MSFTHMSSLLEARLLIYLPCQMIRMGNPFLCPHEDLCLIVWILASADSYSSPGLQLCSLACLSGFLDWNPSGLWRPAAQPGSLFCIWLGPVGIIWEEPQCARLKPAAVLCCHSDRWVTAHPRRPKPGPSSPAPLVFQPLCQRVLVCFTCAVVAAEWRSVWMQSSLVQQESLGGHRDAKGEVSIEGVNTFLPLYLAEPGCRVSQNRRSFSIVCEWF